MREMGNAAGNMGQQVADSAKQMKEETDRSTASINASYLRLGKEAVRLGSNIFQLTDNIDRFSKGQIDAAKFTVLFAGNIMETITSVGNMVDAISKLGLATKILTIIDWAHNAALAVKIGLLTLGIGLVVAAGSIWWFMTQMQSMQAPTPGLPSMQFGGPIKETRPYLLHAGEYILPRGASQITIGAINIYEARTPRETGEAVIDSLRRAGVI